MPRSTWPLGELKKAAGSCGGGDEEGEEEGPEDVVVRRVKKPKGPTWFEQACTIANQRVQC